MTSLGGEDIKKNSKNIFESGYLESCVEAASYSLRVSGTDLIINGKLYNAKNPYPDSVIELPPRKISVLYSEEKLKMANNIYAKAGITFSLKRLGLIDLFGPQIDPNFNGQFIAIVYNLTSKPIRLREGQPLFKMEFYSVQNPLKISPSSSTFKQTDLLDLTTTDSIEDIWKNIWKSKEFLEIQAKVDEVASGYRNVTLFGIFLISVTIFGVVFTILLQNFDRLTILLNQELIEFAFTAIIILFLISWVAILFVLLNDSKRREYKIDKR
jgi:deoxycytidine triphosphate deaminase